MPNNFLFRCVVNTYPWIHDKHKFWCRPISRVSQHYKLWNNWPVVICDIATCASPRDIGSRMAWADNRTIKENTLSNLTSAPCVSSQGNPDGASTRPCPNKLLRIPSNLIPSLKKMSIEFCKLKFLGNKECFSGFTSLEELRIVECPEQISSLVREDEIDDQANGRWLLPCSLGILDIHHASLETLQPCFPGDLTRLTALEVFGINALKSLLLHSCVALEELAIRYCKSLDALEGFQSLRGLRYLKVFSCPGLPRCLKSLSTQGYELCPRLERLRIGDPSFLTTPFCEHLTSLQCLQLESDYEDNIDAAGLTCEQEAALQLLTSLQELQFVGYYELSDLPVGLHSLLSLKRLEISDCRSISRLPERGLPPSLEKLEVHYCSMELTEQCRMLATSKLNVKIDGNYVNWLQVSPHLALKGILLPLTMLSWWFTYIFMSICRHSSWHHGCSDHLQNL